MIIDLQGNAVTTQRREHDQGKKTELYGNGGTLFEGNIQSFFQQVFIECLPTLYLNVIS